MPEGAPPPESTPEPRRVGYADGWVVHKSGWPHTPWQWSAYGPNGGSHGSAPTKEKATERALAAYEAIRGHREADRA